MEHNMPWTEITREQYRRDDLRYASDTRDEEWALIAPLMPAPCKRGRPREVDLRTIVNAILYIGATGCQWRAHCRRIFHLIQPFSTIFMAGVLWACGLASTTFWCERSVQGKGAKRRLRPAS